MVSNRLVARQWRASLALLLLSACQRTPSVTPAPSADWLATVDGRSGAALPATELQQRLAQADYVLLGELHDNAAHHRVRGELLRGARPVVVFEHFGYGAAPLPRPGDVNADTSWLDRNGFDRTGWKWPLHQPLVAAALATGKPLWGSNLSSTALRSVVRQGVDGAPASLASVVRRTPLDSAGRAIQDKEIIDGHCGQLPATMVPGMRVAQEVRDAAMAEAMIAAHRDGPTWLVAGNGHVRNDVAVPRLLRAMVPGARVVSVGLMERGADGVRPPPPRGRYDYVIYTPSPDRRVDPCAGLTLPAR
jgi:uncharacterized iron-regulated protein